MKLLSVVLAAAAVTWAATKVRFDSTQSLSVGEEIAIQGRVQIGEFFGPPGFGENPDKDKIEKFFYLQLPSPVRVATSNASKDPDIGLSFLQIIVRDSNKVPLKDQVGRKVELTGKLVPATGPRNHTPFLIDASEFRPLQKWEAETETAASTATAKP